KGDAGETKVDTKNVLIATGSRPKSLPGMAPDGKQVLTSDEILQIKEIPKSLIVIGAGAVGMEFASMFARFGTAVTVIEMLPRILPLEDEEMSNEAHKVLGKQMAIHVGARTEAALKTPNGVEVGFRTAQGEAKTITADALLVAVRPRPPTHGAHPRRRGGEAPLPRGPPLVARGPRPRHRRAQPGVDESRRRPRLHQDQ